MSIAHKAQTVWLHDGGGHLPVQFPDARLDLLSSDIWEHGKVAFTPAFGKHQATKGNDLRCRHQLPFTPDSEVVPGVQFGRPEWVPSPAFWASLAAQAGPDADRYVSPQGTPLAEDVAFCLLGGYGIRMEVNLAAWQRLKEAEVFCSNPSPDEYTLEALLASPLDVGGHMVRYRFPRQRACRVANALRYLKSNPLEHLCGLELRDALMVLPGIGPKTASWIVRNWAGSDEVAILDVHVIRAGQLMGLFPQRVRLPQDYGELEARFLSFAAALKVPASLLDALIWREMRTLYS